MILFPHMLAGAAVAANTRSLPLAVFLALISHYCLDFLPHFEYPLNELKQGQLRQSFLNFAEISLDFLAGVFVILILAPDFLTALIGGFAGIVPDGLTFLGFFLPQKPKILKQYQAIHKKINNFFGIKNFFWGKMFIQIAVLGLAVFFLRR